MQYKITFRWETTETNIGEIIVGAETEEQALKKVQEIYENGDIAKYVYETVTDCDDFDILDTGKMEK